jgi:AcrR family transcriptional regulator
MLDALPRAVMENGFEGTTVEHIVKLAQVRRNAFYEQFDDKRACFAAAHEIAQERLLGVLTFQCYTRVGLVDRVSSALGAALDLLAANPMLARLIAIEAAAAGGAITERHTEWLDRYGRMLRLAAIGSPEVTQPRAAVEPAVVGGLVSRVKQLALNGEFQRLPSLHTELVQFTLSFYGVRDLASDAPASSARRTGAGSEQPQSPESSSVLEPV